MVFTPGARANGVRVPAELYEESRWYACYTRARHEKRVEHVLRERGIESYLPVVSRIQQWKDRKRRVEFPLFPSYVFGRFTLREMHAVLTTPGVSTIVRINGYPTPIPDRELDNIRRFAMAVADSGCEPEPAAFVREGDWVRVVDGPFRGVVGIVVERRGRRRILVGLRAIGQGLEVDVDVCSLEPVAPPAEEE